MYGPSMLSLGAVGLLGIVIGYHRADGADEGARIKSVLVNISVDGRSFEVGFSNPERVAKLVTTPLAESKLDDSKERHMALGLMVVEMSDGRKLHYQLYQPLGYYLTPEKEHRVADFSAL